MPRLAILSLRASFVWLRLLAFICEIVKLMFLPEWDVLFSINIVNALMLNRYMRSNIYNSHEINEKRKNRCFFNEGGLILENSVK